AGRVRPQPPRSCEDYWEEWKHCRGLRHAFHHYYAHGELPDCGRWREDYEACRAWERDRAAAAQVPGPLLACPGPCRPGLPGQKPRSLGVWKLRKSPPPDWYLPLD
ncbi:CV039 protein, partial [Rhipidura dahli]|nr:CV039 protein [Rhipidura dahli]